jgi:hypothetical protein
MPVEDGARGEAWRDAGDVAGLVGSSPRSASPAVTAIRELCHLFESMFGANSG